MNAKIKLDLGSCPSGPTAGSRTQEWRAADGTLMHTRAFPANRFGAVKRVEVSVWSRGAGTITTRVFEGSDSAARAEAHLDSIGAIEIDDWTAPFYVPRDGYLCIDEPRMRAHIAAAYDAAGIHAIDSFLAGATFGGYGLHGGHLWTSDIQPARMRLVYADEATARAAGIAAQIVMGAFEAHPARLIDGWWCVDVSLLRYVGDCRWDAHAAHPFTAALIAWAGVSPVRTHYDLSLVPGPWRHIGTREEIDAYAAHYEATIAARAVYEPHRTCRVGTAPTSRIVSGTRRRRNARRRVSR